MNNLNLRTTNSLNQATGGFTLIELMIVIAIIAIIITLALPVYSNYTVRTKVGEALSVAAGAKTTTADTCQADPLIEQLTSEIAGFTFDGSPYIATIDISGPCTEPVITVTTRNTGAAIPPVFTLTGDLGADASRMDWTCKLVSGQNIHVPRSCRS